MNLVDTSVAQSLARRLASHCVQSLVSFPCGNIFKYRLNRVIFLLHPKMRLVVRTTKSVSLIFFGLMLIVGLALAKPRSGKRSPITSPKDKTSLQCDLDKLLVYKVTLATHWSRTLFPKQYPEWRPPAQWSKLIGECY